MPKLITYEFVKNKVESETGYILLSDKYESAKSKLVIRCLKGHEYEATWNRWRAGNRCPYCAGNIKYTYDFIKGEFEKEGYKLISDIYHKASEKLLVVCPNGHQYETCWNNFQQGNRCPVCAGNKRLTYDEAKNIISADGYVLLSTSYKNTNSRLRVRCPEGHEYETTLAYFKSGNRCPICAGNIKTPFNEVRTMFENEGYKVLTTEDEYNGLWFTKIEYICPNGHRGSMLGSSFRKGHRCRQCTIISLDHIIKTFLKEGYKVLTTEKGYISARKTKIEYICPNDHRGFIEWNNWIHGQRCPKCRRASYDEIVESFAKENYVLLSSRHEISNVDNINNTYLRYRCPNGHEHAIKWNNWNSSNQKCPFCYSTQYTEIKNSMESEGYTLITKTPDNFTFKRRDVIIYVCPNGHEHSTTVGAWKYGCRCPHCHTSKGETDIRDILDKLGIDYIPNDRTQIINPITGWNLELDIWMPQLRKAIEFNGVYWHKDNYKDDIKVEECSRKGIELLIITDEEWMNDRTNQEEQIIQFTKKGGDA